MKGSWLPPSTPNPVDGVMLERFWDWSEEQDKLKETPKRVPTLSKKPVETKASATQPAKVVAPPPVTRSVDPGIAPIKTTVHKEPQDANGDDGVWEGMPY